MMIERLPDGSYRLITSQKLSAGEVTLRPYGNEVPTLERPHYVGTVTHHDGEGWVFDGIPRRVESP